MQPPRRPDAVASRPPDRRACALQPALAARRRCRSSRRATDRACSTPGRAAPVSPPTPRRPTGAGAAPLGTATPARATLEARGALFLRADRLEGDNQRIDAPKARSSCARAARRCSPTGCHTTIDDQTSSWRRATSSLRRGFDWITGPELQVQARHGDRLLSRSRASSSPRPTRTATRPKSASRVPNHYEATDATLHDVRRAAPRLVPARRASSRSTTCARSAPARRESVYFLGRAGRSIRRGSSSRCRTSASPASSRRRSARPECAASRRRAVLPQPRAELRRDDHAAAMTKRGLQFGGAVPLPVRRRSVDVGQAGGEMNAEILPHDRVTGTDRCALAVDAQPSSSRRGSPASGTSTSVSDDTYFADLADRIAITSQKTLPREAGLVATSGPWSRARARAELPDAAGPERAGRRRRTTAAADPRRTMRDTDWLGLTWSGIGEYARFSQATLAPTGERVVALSDRRAGSRQGPRGSSPRAAGVHVREYILDQTTPRCRTATRAYAIPITSVDAGLVFERDLERAATRRSSQTLEPRAFYVYIPYQRPDRARRCSTPRSTTSTSRSSSPRTATSATTASATRTSSRSRSRRGFSIATPAPSGCASPSASASTSRTSA